MAFLATWIIGRSRRFFLELCGVLYVIHRVVPFESCIRIYFFRQALCRADLLVGTFNQIFRLVMFFLRWHKFVLEIGLGGDPGVSHGGKGRLVNVIWGIAWSPECLQSRGRVRALSTLFTTV